VSGGRGKTFANHFLFKNKQKLKNCPRGNIFPQVEQEKKTPLIVGGRELLFDIQIIQKAENTTSSQSTLIDFNIVKLNSLFHNKR
jgi:hypothetical protein